MDLPFRYPDLNIVLNIVLININLLYKLSACCQCICVLHCHLVAG